MSAQPVLSIGMIVKNEIRCLEKCLKALQPLRDAISCELVIADTGSTDGTREVAEQYADILFDFEWVNDFSAARNAVIDRCTGEWYLTVDADEYLQPNITKLRQFFDHPRAKEYDFGFVIVRNYSSPDMCGNYSDFSALRLAKRIPELRYVGAIHESYNVTRDVKVIDLSEIIFDHDGYTNVSEDHLIKKAERNIPLLEQALKQDPKNLHRLLQCVEGCGFFPEKKEEYMLLGMQEIMGDDRTSKWEKWAPMIARKAIEYACEDNRNETEEWILWARRNFPNSLYVQIDINFCYFDLLVKGDRCSEAIEIGFEYLRGIPRYAQMGAVHPEIQHSPIFKAQKKCKISLSLMLAHLVSQKFRTAEALEILEDVHFQAEDYETMMKWLGVLEQLAYDPRAAELVELRLGHLFAGSDLTDTEEKQKKLIYNRAKQMFGQPSEGNWRIYRKLTKTFECCAALLETWDRVQAEELLRRVTNWSEFVMASLAQAMMLDAELPDGFYHMQTDYLHALENALVEHYKDAALHALHYTAPEQTTDWHRLCFAFDMLCALCMHDDGYDDAFRDDLSERFAQIGELFLSEYYNPKVIANEDAIDRLPALHRFTWYYVRAVELRQKGDWAGYVAGLRKALSEAEVMKKFVQSLLSDVQERQRRDRIAAASPELLSLAEQVKKVLSMYSADDPAVVALKQTPVYQQVAFLIDEPKGTAQ